MRAASSRTSARKCRPVLVIVFIVFWLIPRDITALSLTLCIIRRITLT
jgi:hypothetical protein